MSKRVLVGAVAVVAVKVVLLLAFRRWHLRRGATDTEVDATLPGCDIHSVDRVVPEWQQIAAGDHVRIHPKVSLDVAIAEPDRALVLHGGAPDGEPPSPYDFTWAFVLRPELDGTTRLVMRERYSYNSRWAPLMVEPMATVSFVMSQKMLRGIRDRTERRRAAVDDAV